LDGAIRRREFVLRDRPALETAQAVHATVPGE